MSDKQPFEPYQPEKMIQMTVSIREAKAILRSRKVTFGEFIIFKANNLIIRTEKKQSEMVDENGPVELQ